MTGEIISAFWGPIANPQLGPDVADLVRTLETGKMGGLAVDTSTGETINTSTGSATGLTVIPSVDGVNLGWAQWPGLGDPFPGESKALELTLEINGQEFTRIFPENVTADLDYGAIYNSGQQTASLPPPPPVLTPTWPNMEPDQIAAYQAWLAAGGIGSPPDWVFVNRAQERQRQADAAAALAVIATLPPSMQATYDLGGTGYGSAQQIVLAANPGANAVDILTQATQLQITANAAGVLPAEVVAQNPNAAVIGHTTDPATITPPAGGTSSGQNIPIGPDGVPVTPPATKRTSLFAPLALAAMVILALKAQ